MRPIDADALPISFDGNTVSVRKIDLENAPTLDVAQVVYACWEDGPGYSAEILRDWYMYNTYICSNCREEEKRKSNYCPNCGAIMDLEAQDD